MQKVAQVSLVQPLAQFCDLRKNGKPRKKNSSPYSGCPSTLRVVSATKPLIEGQYGITNQTRRGKSVWYNKEKNLFLSVATTNSWQIKTEKSYNNDDTNTYAHSLNALPALSGQVWCPHHGPYKVWAFGKWTRDIKVLGKIKLKMRVKLRTNFFV